MKAKLRYWNRYGFEADVFDRYREAIRVSNRRTVRVLGALAVAAALAVAVYGILRGAAGECLVLCAVLCLCGAAGLFAARRQEVSRRVLLGMGYLLSVAFYMLNIYGSVVMDTAAFWLGAHLALACCLVDYAGRIGLMQIASLAAVMAAWSAFGVKADVSRWFFCLLYLAAGLVIFYTVNRGRILLIADREENRPQEETDLLTGLTVRAAAQKMIAEHLESDEHGVLMLLDLDRFRRVNDRLGHQMGDQVLIDVAADLKKMFRNSDVLSRLGSDEFVVYMKSVPEKEWALQRAGQLVRELRRWVGNGTTNIQISVSVGVVMTDMVERDYDSLYRAADAAMCCAKREGGNMALFFSPEMTENVREEEDRRNPVGEAGREDSGFR